MSEEEQQNALGKLVVERKTANQERLLLEDEVRGFGVLLMELKSRLAAVSGSFDGIDQSLHVLDLIQQKGGLEQLIKALTRYRELSLRVQKIGEILEGR